jgi:hypothetical protein
MAEQFRDYLLREAEETATGLAGVADPLERILQAETLDDILDADFIAGIYSSQELAGIEIEILDLPIRWAKGAERFDSPLGVYAQFKATVLIDFPDQGISAGEEVTITTGATLVIGKLRTLQANGFLPAKVKLIGKETASGVVLKLGRIPARAVPSETAETS